MTRFINRLLDSSFLWITARILICVVFLISGLMKLIMFDMGVSEMRNAGLEPAVLVNVFVASYLIIGSTLILFNRYLWLGAFSLAVFLLLAIPVALHFWTMEEPQATFVMHAVVEHISLVGGLVGMAIASRAKQRLRSIY